jgi:hypothetical protein
MTNSKEDHVVTPITKPPYDTKALAKSAAERLDSIMKNGSGVFTQEEGESIALCLRALETTVFHENQARSTR